MEAKFCNFSLSTKSVSAAATPPSCRSVPSRASLNAHAAVLPCRAQLQTLYKYIEQKGNLQELQPLLTTLTKHKTAVSQHAKQGIKDLEEVTGLLHKLAVKLQVKQD